MLYNQAKELLLKYQSGRCTAEEQAIVEDWITFGKVTDFNPTDQDLERNLNDLDRRLGITQNIKRPRINYNIVAAAAAILLFLGTAFYFYSPKTSITKDNTKLLAEIQDINPGSNKATLTLADHETFDLEKTPGQTLVQENNLNISNTQQGQLIYQVSESNLSYEIKPENPLALHIVTTPRGGQYRITLSDGTKVWLNSYSSLKFPAQFSSNERNVELKGEAYFEVAKNAAKPFKVKVNSTVVKVLGTHFNIMAYNDEPLLKTTLLEGSVQLNNGTTANVLKPGQQGIVNKSGFVKVVNADTEQSIAWKNGYFFFNKTKLTDIMKQLSRWYNIDIIYKGKMPVEEEFVGKIRRDFKLSKTLEMLEFSNVNFKTTGNQLIVTPK